MPLRHLTINEKSNLINDLENKLINETEASKIYHTSRSTVYRTLADKTNVMNAKREECGRRTRAIPQEISLHDNYVKKFILTCQDKGVPISANLIIQVAKEGAIVCKRTELKCSWRWFSRFKERVKLKQGVLSGESKSIDLNYVINWQKINIPRIELNWQQEFIYNCDETGLFWRQTPIKSYFISKTDHKGDKLFNERITIMFAVNMNGDKLPLLIVGKSKKPRCFSTNQATVDSLNLTYTSQTNAWMTKELFVSWLIDHHKSLLSEGKKIVLLLDNFKGHDVDQSLFTNITFEFLPPSTTCYTQPLDGGIIKTFKSNYLAMFIKKLVENIETYNNVSEIVQSINLVDALVWVDLAWKSVKKETIVNCWKHCKFNLTNQTNLDDDNFFSNDNDNLSQMLSELNILTNNQICTENDLIDQVTFDYINYFD